MVSIIVPVYNCENFLERCIVSIVEQSYKEIEVVLVDDGSQDKSLQIAQEWERRDSRIRVLGQENSGVSAARNKGIANARGTYICFVDSDDYIEKDMIKRMVQAYREKALVVSNFVHNDRDVLVLNPVWEAYETPGNRKKLANLFLNGQLGKQIAFSVGNKMFLRKQIVDNNILFPVGVSLGEDMIFVMQYLFTCCSIIYINEGLYHYCIRDDSAMNAKNKDYLSCYDGTLRVLKEFQTLDETILAKWSLEALIIILTSGFVVEMNFSQFREYYKRLRVSSLVVYAKKRVKTQNWKRTLLNIMLRSDCLTGVYLLTVVNKVL